MSAPQDPSEFAFYVDRHGVLAIPGTFWLGMAVLCRHWLLILVVGLVSRRGDAGLGALLGTGGVPWLAMAAEVPAMVLAFAALARSPLAGSWARWVWTRGPAVIGLTAILHLAVTWQLVRHAGPPAFNPHGLWFGLTLLDLAFLLSAVRSPYFRAMFREFPASPELPNR
jgi:hypothetical protein